MAGIAELYKRASYKQAAEPRSLFSPPSMRDFAKMPEPANHLSQRQMQQYHSLAGPGGMFGPQPTVFSYQNSGGGPPIPGHYMPGANAPKGTVIPPGYGQDPQGWPVIAQQPIYADGSAGPTGYGSTPLVARNDSRFGRGRDPSSHTQFGPSYPIQPEELYQGWTNPDATLPRVQPAPEQNPDLLAEYRRMPANSDSHNAQLLELYGRHGRLPSDARSAAEMANLGQEGERQGIVRQQTAFLENLIRRRLDAGDFRKCLPVYKIDSLPRFGRGAAQGQPPATPGLPKAGSERALTPAERYDIQIGRAHV